MVVCRCSPSRPSGRPAEAGLSGPVDPHWRAKRRRTRCRADDVGATGGQSAWPARPVAPQPDEQVGAGARSARWTRNSCAGWAVASRDRLARRSLRAAAARGIDVRTHDQDVARLQRRITLQEVDSTSRTIDWRAVPVAGMDLQAPVHDRWPRQPPDPRPSVSGRRRCRPAAAREDVLGAVSRAPGAFSSRSGARASVRCAGIAAERRKEGVLHDDTRVVVHRHRPLRFVFSQLSQAAGED